MGERKNYYSILGITDEEKKLSQEEFKKLLKKKFRKISLDCHPDKQGGKSDAEKKQAEEKFKAAAEAYEVLSDKDKRAKYDNPNVDFHFDGFSGGGFDDIFSRFSQQFGFDPFAGFNFTTTAHGPKQGQNIRLRVKLTLEDILNGSQKTLRYERMERCDKCHGTGMVGGSVRETCKTCGGTGSEFLTSGGMQIITQCRACGGKGTIIKNPCPDCNGSGVVKKKHEVQVNIPKGAFDGMQFTLGGEGNASSDMNGQNGDLYVLIEEVDHNLFYRAGNDLRFTLQIPIIDALLGCEVNVHTIDGKTLKTKIQPCVEEGTEIAFRGYGLPEYGHDRRGNMIAIITHKMPNGLTDSDKEILRKLKESPTFS